MLGVVEQWLGEEAYTSILCDADSPLSADMGQSKAQETIACLTKDAVREGKNKREGESPDGQGSIGGYSGGYSSGRPTGGSTGGGSPSTEQGKTCDLLRGGGMKLIISQLAARNPETRNPDPDTAAVSLYEYLMRRF